MNSSLAPHDVLRHGDPAQLAQALQQVRALNLRCFAAWQAALASDMAIPYAEELNPPRWEFGHVAWFEERWLLRNPQRERGALADPTDRTDGSLLLRADAMLDSSTVPHAARWHLPALPSAEGCRAYAQAVRERSLQQLKHLAPDASDAALYFFRLVLAHECMHVEASLYMARQLGVPMPELQTHGRSAGDAGAGAGAGAATGAELALALHIPAGTVQLGSPAGGFAFDNELPAHAQAIGAFDIDARPVSQAQWAKFVQAGALDARRHWSEAGWVWRKSPAGAEAAAQRRPSSSSNAGGASPVEVNFHEAQAWCHWAGRRLPSEAQWCQAQALAGAALEWGEVWEWTATAFAPFDGFVPHPYRDYSAPWFDGRPVLKGASVCTLPWMRHPAYRNFFRPERRDMLSGFRSCAL